MEFLIFKEIGLVLSAQPGHFLEEMVHLTLEFNMDDRVIGKTNVLLREATTGTWEADKGLILCRIDEKCTLSVYLNVGREERQLLGHTPLFGIGLLDNLGERIEIPLMADEAMILKVKVEVESTDDILSLTCSKNAFNLLDEFERSGNLSSLEQAISQYRLASEMVSEDDPNRHSILQNLAMCLSYRFKRLGNIEDLESCIAQEQAVLNLTPDGHPEKPARLNNLGNSILTRFQRFGNVDDIDNAIAQHQLAVVLTPDGDPDKPGLLSNLGNSLHARFNRFGNVDDIANTIVQDQLAVNLVPDSYPGRPRLLSNLGSSLSTRFDRFGNVDDIGNAIVQQQLAIDLTPDGHPDKPDQSNDLGQLLMTRFNRFGNVGDINNAIVQLQLAINLTPDGHPNKPNRLNSLGIAHQVRFDRFGNVGDIDNAIAQQQLAVDLTPDGHPDMPNRLNNLGTSLSIRFNRFNNVGDINNAVAQHQLAVKLTPDGHPDKPMRLSSLGNSLQARFHCFGNVDDINNAIAQHQLAVNLTPDGHPNKPMQLISLGTSLIARFWRFGDLKDNDKAIAEQSLAVDLTPVSHPSRLGGLNGLGVSFLSRFLRSHRSDDFEAAIAHFSAAAQSPIGSPSHRLYSAQNWIRVASVVNHQSLIAAYECALAIIPLVAWLGLPIKDRHQHLVQMGTIARDAAATAISLQRYDKALEWSEQGRSLVWTQILQLRTPVDQLHDVDPKLAGDLLRISRLLDSGTEQLDLHGVRSSREEEGRRYRALAKEWEEIIEKIREIPGFRDFLRPPRLPRLINAARNGPVVVLNMAEKRCDALALIDGVEEVIHIPLPDLTLEKATELQADLTALLKWSNIRMRAVREPEYEDGGNGECKRILGELWDRLVKPVLDSLAFSSRPDKLARIWWCVTGPLAFLPIHAAGNYDGSPDEQLHNYVISSYTPTLTALLGPPRATADTPFKMLSVIEPSTGRYYIPNTKVELERIQRRLKDRDHSVLEGPDATKKRVLEAMKDHHWLHLACHGLQNARSPTKSSLKLRDDDLFLDEIIKLNLPQAEFAFLSACQTVTGDQKLSEEAVHIAGGMLLAGYRSVVATMWSIEDKLAPEVADEFYGHLMEDGVRPDSRKAAEALHVSVQKLRQKGGIPMVSWLPFVHIGV